MKWIFGSAGRDVLWLCAPGLLAIAFSWLLKPSSSWGFLVFAFVAKGLLDGGHVFATNWRTYFHLPEFRRRRLYLILPFLLFTVFYLWMTLDFPGLAALVIYATFFHNLRQFFGISKWYQKLNGRMDKWADLFLYLNGLLPFAIFHFRDIGQNEFYYTGDSMFFYKNQNIEEVLLIAYGVALIVWLSYSIFSILKRKEWNIFSATFVPSVVYGCALVFGATEAQVIFPLVVSHGASYLALVSLAMGRVSPQRFSSMFAPALLVILTAGTMGGWVYYYDDVFTELDHNAMPLLTALFLTSLFSHYIYDGFLWRRTHPEAPLIYS